MQLTIKPFNVIDRNELSEMTVDRLPVDGDPLEINWEMYYVCETNSQQKDYPLKIGVIPLVIKNPKMAENIEHYLRYLSVAKRKIQYRNDNNV